LVATSCGFERRVMNKRFLLALGLTLLCVSCGSGPSAPTTPQFIETKPPTLTRTMALSGNMQFGQVTVGQTASSTLTVTNTGTGPITVTGILYQPSSLTGYSTDWSSGTILAGSTQLITVRFTPTAAGNYDGALSVMCYPYLTGGGPNTVNLSGVGR
jgi:hypothetical protein